MKKVVILLFIAFTFSCEKDDICDQATTSRVVIEFYDNLITTDVKSVTSLRVKEIESTEAYGTFSSSTIQLPLKTTDDATKYSLILNSTDAVNLNEDFIQFNYTRKNVYVSRACGYKTVYELDATNPITLTDTSPADGLWIQNIVVINKTIENEIETHVKIYF
jgi:hypothetical protein